MKSHNLFYLIIGLFGLFVFTFCSCTKEEKKIIQEFDKLAENLMKPNIVFFLIDDIGVISTPAYSANMDGSYNVSATQDTGYVQNGPGGSYYPYTTPNINKLASESLLFNYMYATPLCAPSRGQLMTGLYPFETGIVYPCFPDPGCGSDWTFGPATPENPGQGYLDPKYTTYPKMLRDSGNYYTGFGGKWNLRWGVPNYTADRRNDYDKLVKEQADHLKACGFTNIYNPVAPTALLGNTVDYFPPQLRPDSTINQNYFPFSLNAWASDFLDDAQAKRQKDGTPFYLHYCAGLIHDDENYEGLKPIPGYPSNITRYEHFGNKIHVVDSLIGIIIDKIQNDSILSANTILIVAGDNGTEEDYTTMYRGNPIEGAKFSPRTHGSNVPFIVNWADTLSPGTYTQLADFSDIHSTITDIAGVSDPSIPTSGFSFLKNMKLPDSLRTETRSYIYSQASHLHDYPVVPSGVDLGTADAFIANQSYSLIPTAEGGALFSVSSFEDTYLCQNGCKGTGYEDAYCRLYTELIELGPNPDFVPYKTDYKCKN